MAEPVPVSGSQDSIAGYRILEALGQGGMGEVFLAWDERLQRNVAVKRIRHDGILSDTLRLRLLREAQAVARLSHPAIVHIYDLKEDPAGDCIVMEYVPGQTLAEAVATRPFELAHAVRLAREIATGLEAAHAAGIVHRDLKTENVILTPSGHAKILDFGLAKPVVPAAGDSTLTERGCVVGTCRSMSPEQARGHEVDGRSDLFSLGVLLYEVLTGEHPFEGATNLDRVAQVLKHHPPRVDSVRPGVPLRLCLLIEHLLAKDVADRPQSADQVVRELEAIEVALPGPSAEETLSELPTGYFRASQAAPSHPVPRSNNAPQSTAGMSTHSRSPWPRIAALVVLSALILGVGGYSIHQYYAAPKLGCYAELREIKEKLKKEPLSQLPRVKAMADSCPSFAEAQLLAADMYFTQFDSSRDNQYLDSAEAFALRARHLARRDSQPLFILFKVKMAHGATEDAKDILEDLEDLQHGDPQLLLLRSQLAEREGRKADALRDMRALVDKLPIWDNLFSLADLEARTGHIDDARNHIVRILLDSPDNRWALEKRAQIELLYGDPAGARDLYRRLILREPQRYDYTNLGNADVLLGDYQEAVDSFIKALSFDPDNVTVTISLADAELALKRDGAARDDYHKALQTMARNLNGVSFTPSDYATRAQCLAQLNQLPQAREDIQKALERSPDDGNVLQAAALVYVVAGDKSQALVVIKKALDEGVNPRWFQLPAFDSLNHNPEYDNMMKVPGATSSR